MARRVDFAEAARQFLEEKRESTARATWVQYERTLSQAGRFLAEMNVTKCHTVQPSHVNALFYSDTKGWRRPSPVTGTVLGPGSMNLHLAAIKLFFKWCVGMGYMTFNPATHINRLRYVPSKKIYFSRDQLKEILDSARHPRDRVLLALAIYSGRRVGEVLTIRVRDVDFGRRELSIIHHKTGDRRVVDAYDELLEEISKWLLFYEEKLGRPLTGEMYLVPRMDRPRLTGGKVQPALEREIIPDQTYTGGHDMLKKVLEERGYYEKGQAFHIFRRSIGRLLYDELTAKDESKDRALRLVQAFYGHKTRAITENYLGLEVEREELSQFIKNRRFFPDPTTPAKADNVIPLRKEEAS